MQAAGTGPLSESERGEPTTHRRIGAVLWRRRWIVVGTFVVLTVLVALVANSLPKEYETTATLWVTEGSGVTTFDSVQAGQVLAGTYGKVADNEVIADKVAGELPFEKTGEEVLSSTSFEPVSETQLLKITATDREPVRARVIANTYAKTFIAYSRSQLGDAVRAHITFAAPAPTPTQPSRPQPALYTIAGALIALLLGAGLALLAEALDRHVRSADELEEIAGVPVLARIPAKDRTPETREAFEEAFRLLRTNLQFLDRDGSPLRSLAIVSPSPSDGKSTVAFNLARSFAEAEVRVILIEADMRRPSLGGAVAARRMSPEQPGPGLSDYLTRKSDIFGVLAGTDLPTLRFISSGVLPPSPSSQFSAERTRMLLADALMEADLVILDTPPLSVGAEASTIAGSVDASLMVVDLDSTKKRDIRAGRQQLGVVHTNLSGLVVNRVKSLPTVGPYGYGNAPNRPRGKRRQAGINA
jgi:capsular exopolysaccharide synthesis family protein